MSISALNWAWDLNIKSHLKLVLLALADHSGFENECWPSITKISLKCSLSKRSVIRFIAELVKLNLIQKDTRYDQNGNKKTNLYCLNIDQKLPTGWCQPDTKVVSECNQGSVTQTPGWCQADTYLLSNEPPIKPSYKTLKKKYKMKISENDSKPLVKKQSHLPDLPGDVQKADWDDFVQHRKDMKAPMSQMAQARALSKIKDLISQGQDAHAVIDQSIVNGWKGLFPVKDDKLNVFSGAKYGARPETNAQRHWRNCEEALFDLSDSSERTTTYPGEMD